MSKLQEYNLRSKSSPCLGVDLPQDLQHYKDSFYKKYLQPHGLEIPGYAIRPLEAAIEATGIERATLIEKARQNFELCYLGAWSKGVIRVGDEHKPMPEEIKKELKELYLQRKALKEDKKPVPAVNKKSRPKGPVYLDKIRQSEIMSKYAWVTDSFKQDPHKPGGTVVDIKCQKCGSLRTIHIADCFQTKLCLNCRNINGK